MSSHQVLSRDVTQTTLRHPPRSGRNDFGGLIAFAVGVLGTAAVVVPVGPLSLSAVIGLFLTPVTWRHIVAHRFIRLWIAAWVIAIGISVAAHASKWQPTLAQALYPMAILVVAGIWVYLSRRSPARLAWITVGVAAGLALGVAIQPVGISSEQSVIKSGYGLAVALAWFGLTSTLRASKLVQAGGGFAIAAWLLLSDFRSGAVIVAVATLLLLITSFIKRLTLARALVVVLIGCGASLGALSLYSSLAADGTLGSEAQTRYLNQSESSGGLLVAGRPEFVVSMSAIASSPWLGRGGDPEFTFDERLTALSALESEGVYLSPVNIARVAGDRINSHSLFFSGWVANGVLGVVPWVGFLAIAFSAAALALKRRSPLAAIAIFLAVQLSWDVLFSPWSPRAEGWFALPVALLIIQLRRESVST